MTKWEYISVQVSKWATYAVPESQRRITRKPDDFYPHGTVEFEYDWKSFDQLGSQGWELVSIFWEDADSGQGIFKRPIST